MMTLITGGSKCGKSSLAEELLSGLPKKVYLAAMIPYGEEALEAVARHRKARAGKEFITIEQYTDVHRADAAGCNVLLECLGNLCANELFREDVRRAPDETAAHIIEGIRTLRTQAENLVIVTNQVGSDGAAYAPKTMEYIHVLGRVNQAAAQIADCVIECVYGIPVVLKGHMPQGTGAAEDEVRETL